MTGLRLAVGSGLDVDVPERAVDDALAVRRRRRRRAASAPGTRGGWTFCGKRSASLIVCSTCAVNGIGVAFAARDVDAPDLALAPDDDAPCRQASTRTADRRRGPPTSPACPGRGPPTPTRSRPVARSRTKSTLCSRTRRMKASDLPSGDTRGVIEPPWTLTIRALVPGGEIAPDDGVDRRRSGPCCTRSVCPGRDVLAVVEVAAVRRDRRLACILLPAVLLGDLQALATRWRGTSRSRPRRASAP